MVHTYSKNDSAYNFAHENKTKHKLRSVQVNQARSTQQYKENKETIRTLTKAD